MTERAVFTRQIAAWRCDWCGRLFPVESLARDHEKQHQEGRL